MPAKPGLWRGVAMGRSLSIEQIEDSYCFHRVSLTEFETIWRPYLDLDRDYGDLLRRFSEDPLLKKAGEYAPGIRILRQEPWEALCSFIISQNNNIPRIRGIIERLCAAFGTDLGGGLYTFPPARVLAECSLHDLVPLRAGFRAKYILDAARKVSVGEVSLENCFIFPLEEARAELMKICGVGPKVADCALLFGCARLDAFPRDTWIGKVMTMHYPEGLPRCAGEFRGVAQQYLFYYARFHPDFLENN